MTLTTHAARLRAWRGFCISAGASGASGYDPIADSPTRQVHGPICANSGHRAGGVLPLGH